HAAAADVHAEKREGLVTQVHYERPLVGPLGPSRQSHIAPEIEQHHLPAIVAQLEALAVLILALDVRGFSADTQVSMNPWQGEFDACTAGWHRALARMMCQVYER